ncbi:hypothetical protein G5I_02377 [Acromyrmex echinatior]|uniref:Uncharacterized protein n=1 Tax=Acromyrmex echinatior TaxID=103372 RepID=F4WA60_ACREC|nr:hypothetical protein G5I_02377 [Acromyrmex echinatior]
MDKIKKNYVQYYNQCDNNNKNIQCTFFRYSKDIKSTFRVIRLESYSIAGIRALPKVFNQRLNILNIAQSLIERAAR